MRVTRQPYNTPHNNRTDALIAYFLDWKRILSGEKKLHITGLDQHIIDAAMPYKIRRGTREKIRTRMSNIETFYILSEGLTSPRKLFNWIIKDRWPDEIVESKRHATLDIMNRYIIQHGLTYVAGGPEYWLNNVQIPDDNGNWQESYGLQPMSTEWASPAYPEILKQIYQKDAPSLNRDPA